ncbi:prenylcysteine oxidase 1 [Rhizodiscina lignyota]|uniref:Prenylcysteine oxidase 1 n=1 Tax=Rhizodiscina lignyota TaxID=1504668 RepID=A0A9P4IAU8_9PEZI|nr:prenylcysteine oxidase 1 [Rhizodiscina lignyota]
MRFARLALASCFAVSQAQVLHQDAQQPLKLEESARRVAVIGAGAAGASAAYHLRKFADEAGVKANITIFERNAYIGGRSTTVQAFDDPSSDPIELGASIFVKVNYILSNATEEFGLRTVELGSAREYDGYNGTARLAAAPLLGVWDGEKFLITQSATNRWWDTAKLLWRYGLAPIRTNNLVKKTVNAFLSLYEEPMFPFASLSDAAYELGLTAVTATTGWQYLEENKVGGLFAQEVVQAATRVNYAQNLGLIHGLETMVCMATDGAVGVEGGNWKIFEKMVEGATKDVLLGTAVSAVRKVEGGGYILEWKEVEGGDGSAESKMKSEHFDSVVLAAPHQFSDIEIAPESKRVPDKVPYVQLHVTLFTSPHLLSPQAFNLPPDELVPEIILTTLQPDEKPGSDPKGVGRAGFFSISLLQPIVNRKVNPPREEFTYKIFSPTEIDAKFLIKILGLQDSPLGAEDDEGEEAQLDVSKEDVSWIYRKVWHSYPYHYPRVTFEEISLDKDFWYTSGIEGFISTMETSALMGKNVARLIVDDWMGRKKDTHVDDGGKREL